MWCRSVETSFPVNDMKNTFSLSLTQVAERQEGKIDLRPFAAREIEIDINL